MGQYTSLAILPSGQPAISYYSHYPVDLSYAWYDGSEWHTTGVDGGGSSGYLKSLKILPSGQPAISHYDTGNGGLRYAARLAASGDVNCDGLIDAFDIAPFVLAISDENAYYAAYPDCNVMLADINEDGDVNAFDIDPFVELLTGG